MYHLENGTYRFLRLWILENGSGKIRRPGVSYQLQNKSRAIKITIHGR
jgi:hypothetical protein